jgi:mannose-6-phosphate isomerase-like protein (cupin superfamily)
MDSHVLGPDEGKRVSLGGLGVRFMIDAARSGGGFSLVEHPIAPRTLAAPMHVHEHEDEYSYVLEGRMGAQIGDHVIEAGPGELVFKPRGIPHAFWNPTDEPCRLLEIISPGGFEQQFADVAACMPADGPPDIEGIAKAQARYGLAMDFTTIPSLCQEHGLNDPTAAPAAA